MTTELILALLFLAVLYLAYRAGLLIRLWAAASEHGLVQRRRALDLLLAEDAFERARKRRLVGLAVQEAEVELAELRARQEALAEPDPPESRVAVIGHRR